MRRIFTTTFARHGLRDIASTPIDPKARGADPRRPAHRTMGTLRDRNATAPPPPKRPRGFGHLETAPGFPTTKTPGEPCDRGSRAAWAPSPGLGWQRKERIAPRRHRDNRQARRKGRHQPNGGQGVKERAKVPESQGMTMSDAVKAMVRIGIRQNRIPLEVTREPEVAGIGMRDGNAKFYGIAKDGTGGRSGDPGGMTIKMSPGTRGTCANGAAACAPPRTRSPITTWGRPPSSCAYRSTTSKRRRFGKPRLAGTPFARADTNDGLTEHCGINRERPRGPASPADMAAGDGAGAQARDEAALLRYARDAQRLHAHVYGEGRHIDIPASETGAQRVRKEKRRVQFGKSREEDAEIEGFVPTDDAIQSTEAFIVEVD